MWKNKYIRLLFILFFINACSTAHKKSLFPIRQKSSDSYLEKVEANFEKGGLNLKSGELDASRYFFNRTINILLDSDAKNALAPKPFMYYIDKIAQIELRYFQDNETNNLEKNRNFLQDVISAPLFSPSEKDVTRLKQKVYQEKPAYSFPMVVNDNLAAFLNAFQTVKRDAIQRAINRSNEYIEPFKKIFSHYEIPEDLVYLPIIESGFRIDALSRARARGMWQFMASTGRMFGLRIDWMVDERLDPFKSAAAAAKYLKCLHEEFGDWYLVLACYNGGTRRINRAIQNLKTRDFFRIAQTRYLRRETRNYIPAFLASLIIAKSPLEYGFSLEETEWKFTDTKMVEIPSPVDLQTVAIQASISYHTLKSLNPELIHDFTPFDKTHYLIRLPANTDEIPLKSIVRMPPEKEFFVGWYRVKKGDNLYSIARKFNTSVRKIKNTNQLNSNLIRPGKRLLIPRG